MDDHDNSDDNFFFSCVYICEFYVLLIVHCCHLLESVAFHLNYSFIWACKIKFFAMLLFLPPLSRMTRYKSPKFGKIPRAFFKKLKHFKSPSPLKSSTAWLYYRSNRETRVRDPRDRRRASCATRPAHPAS